MRPKKDLPYSDEFALVDDYVAALLEFVSTSELFQMLCGGVHILDFFTSDPGLFFHCVPEDWQSYLLQMDITVLLDFLMRDDLDGPVLESWPGQQPPPPSLVRYVKDIRRLSLARSFAAKSPKLPMLPTNTSFGMKPKKLHEVTNFAGYVDQLAEEVAQGSGQKLTHFIDFGSGQNYLGRVLASPPYNKHIVAVESKEANMTGAKALDVLSGVAEGEKILRNKKVFMRVLESVDPSLHNDEDALRNAAKSLGLTDLEIASIDLRTRRELKAFYTTDKEKGSIEYVVGRLENADLSDVVTQMQQGESTPEPEDLRMMAISIHSCGNLSHFGIRSMVMNTSIRAVAIVGCCYNLMTEKLGPPTYKLPFHRPSLQAINGRVLRESARQDPHGYPMSARVSTYKNDGIRLNITARMMACQAPQNWTEKDSDGFFTRHYFRAVLQRIFLDRGVISRVYHGEGGTEAGVDKESPFNMSTNPVIIGSLRKDCYKSFHAYVRGAVTKLTTNSDYGQYTQVIQDKIANITDEEIAEYEAAFRHRKKEISIVWSLMAFSAGVVESLIVTDRWLFLREQSDIVRDTWVETVFDFRESPRNLVVVGIKR